MKDFLINYWPMLALMLWFGYKWWNSRRVVAMLPALKARGALLVDVRSTEERKFVGHVPGSLHVAWATGTSLVRNPRFVRELEAKLAKDGGKDAVVLLLCRSGVRSIAAAQRATALGFEAYNILEGFEGDADELGQRGRLGGWRDAAR